MTRQSKQCLTDLEVAPETLGTWPVAPGGDHWSNMIEAAPSPDGESITWLVARTGGPGYDRAVRHHDVWSRGILAHTSPIYVAVGGPWQLTSEDTAQYMLTLIDGSLSYIRELAPRYESGTVTHHHGQADHGAYLERPFLEAQTAIHRKLRELGTGR